MAIRGLFWCHCQARERQQRRKLAKPDGQGDRDICGRQPPSAARIGPFILGRSGWQFAILWLVAQALELVNYWLRAAQPAVDFCLPKRKARRLELGGGPGRLFLLRFYFVSLGASAQIHVVYRLRKPMAG